MKRFLVLLAHVSLFAVLAADCKDHIFEGGRLLLLSYPKTESVTIILKKPLQKRNFVQVSAPQLVYANETIEGEKGENIPVLNIKSTGAAPTTPAESSAAPTTPAEASGCHPKAGPRPLEYLTVIGFGLLLMGMKSPPWFMVGAVAVTALAVSLPTTDADCAGATITVAMKPHSAYFFKSNPPARIFCDVANGNVPEETFQTVNGVEFSVWTCPWIGGFERVYSDPANDQLCDAASPETVTVAAAFYNTDLWTIGANPSQKVRDFGFLPHAPYGSQRWVSNISFGENKLFSQVGMLVGANGKESELVPVVASLPDGKICKFTYRCKSGACLSTGRKNCGMIGPGGTRCSSRINSTQKETRNNENCGQPCNSFECTAVCTNDDCIAFKPCSDPLVSQFPACATSLQFCTCPESRNCHVSNKADRQILGSVFLAAGSVVTGWLFCF